MNACTIVSVLHSHAAVGTCWWGFMPFMTRHEWQQAAYREQICVGQHRDPRWLHIIGRLQQQGEGKRAPFQPGSTERPDTSAAMSGRRLQSCLS